MATVDALLQAGANPNLAGDGPDGGCLDLDLERWSTCSIASIVDFTPPVSPLQAAEATNQSAVAARLVAAGAHAPAPALPSGSATGVC